MWLLLRACFVIFPTPCIKLCAIASYHRFHLHAQAVISYWLEEMNRSIILGSPAWLSIHTNIFQGVFFFCFVLLCFVLFCFVILPSWSCLLCNMLVFPLNILQRQHNKELILYWVISVKFLTLGNRNSERLYMDCISFDGVLNRLPVIMHFNFARALLLWSINLG